MSKKNYGLVIIMAVLLAGLSVSAWFGPKQTYSDSERRKLAEFPEMNRETFLSGEFMPEFEDYSLDHFPLRDGFRTLKALTGRLVFQTKTNNGIYLEDGYLSKLEYPLNESMVDYAVSKLDSVYKTYLEPYGSKAYLAPVPDKNYFLAEKNGYPSMDYERMFERLQKELPAMQYIDITSCLSIEDYYFTDTHWRQEKLMDVAKLLGEAMGAEVETEYEIRKAEAPFYGVYHGQSALPLMPEQISYLTNSTLEACKVYSLESGSPKEEPLYNFEKLKGKDGYEFFLSGARALQVIENPNAKTQKELLVFRDSFGSSLIPLLVEGYSKITVIDIRYMNSAYLGNLIDFKGQDALFMYSTMILNNSTALH